MKRKLSPDDVVVVGAGRPEWHRYLIFHTGRRLYWGQNRWRKHRRDAQLWHDRTLVLKEIEVARLHWKTRGIEDE